MAWTPTETLFRPPGRSVGLRGVWVVRMSDLLPRQLYANGQAFTGVALSGDGTGLYAADPARGLLLIPLATSGTPQALTVPVGSPWGGAWIAG